MSSFIEESTTGIDNLIELVIPLIEAYTEIKQWEIYASSNQSSDLQVEKGYVKSLFSNQGNSIVFRFFGAEGKTGSSVTTSISKQNLKFAIDTAYKIMKSSVGNPDFKSLPEKPKSYHEVKNLWDPTIANMSIDEFGELIDAFLVQRTRDPRIKTISGDISVSQGSERILNSNGIDYREKGTNAHLSIEFIMEEDKNGNKVHSNGFDFQNYAFLQVLKENMNDLFDNAYESALKSLNKTTISTGKYPVILAPYAVDLLMCDPIVAGVNAESVYYHRSFLQDKLNTQITSDILNIKDDPWLEGGLSSTMADAEGYATRPKSLIENGILKTYLHNSYTANLFNVPNTGNAVRSIGSPNIGIGASNIIVTPGDISKDEMIADIKDGVLFMYTFDSPNIVTGEFSGLVTNAFRIQNGEIGGCLKETTFGLNFLEFLKGIEQISKEVKRIDSSYLPYIKVKNLAFSGK